MKTFEQFLENEFEYLIPTRPLTASEKVAVELAVKAFLKQKRQNIIDDRDWTTNNLTKIGAKRAIDELLSDLGAKKDE